MGPCILIFGVSGVGKTSACRAYVEEHPDALFVSASSLLKAAKGVSSEALRTANSAEIVGNQAVLGIQLEAFRRGRESQTVLVDAHGVIDNDVELVRIPVAVIRELTPTRLILLEAAPKIIASRRAMDQRQRPKRSLKAISLELHEERAAVEDYARVLGLELLIAEVGPTFKLEVLLENPDN